MSSDLTQNTRDINISIVPLHSMEVEYFKEINIPFSITNNSTDQVLIETITFRFQTDADAADTYIERRCDCLINPGDVLNRNFVVSPTPDFLANTNVFDIMIAFRKSISGVPQEQLLKRFRGSYIIVKHPTQKLGQLFISFKQPEDLRLAKIIARLAERAGFDPYLAIHDSQPGVQLWERIEPILQASVADLVLWTKYTIWGDGVPREIDLCRKHQIPEVLLIQEGLELPESYRGTAIEYKSFDPDDPHKTFSKVIASLRKVIL
jgi:hypothetical protein